MSFLIILLFLVIIVGMYIGTYLINKNTKPPMDIDISQCGGCHSVECNHHPSHKKGEC